MGRTQINPKHRNFISTTLKTNIVESREKWDLEEEECANARGFHRNVLIYTSKEEKEQGRGKVHSKCIVISFAY